jgi:DNA-binding response OmpR family regulator
LSAPGFDGSAAAGGRRRAVLAPRPLVVLIEDDPFVAAMIVAELEAAGFGAVAFADGQTALRQFLTISHAAAVILDWGLPELDGASVLQRLRTGGYSGPVIVFTGNADVRFAAIANGATDCFEKSQSFAPVLGCLRMTLESSAGQGFDC